MKESVKKKPAIFHRIVIYNGLHCGRRFIMALLSPAAVFPHPDTKRTRVETEEPRRSAFSFYSPGGFPEHLEMWSPSNSTRVLASSSSGAPVFGRDRAGASLAGDDRSARPGGNRLLLGTPDAGKPFQTYFQKGIRRHLFGNKVDLPIVHNYPSFS